MPTTFHVCPEPIRKVAETILEKHFPNFARVGLKVSYRFANNEESPPLKIGGFSVSDKVKIVPLADRADGDSDVKITIDEAWWNGADENDRLGMFHRAFKHLQLKAPSDKDIDEGRVVGGFKADDLGRPVLKFRHCDYMASGFYDTIEHFGTDSAEVRQLAAIGKKVKELTQKEFWG